MSDYLSVNSADRLLETAAQQLEAGNHIKVRTDGDRVSWSVDKYRGVKQVLTGGLYGKRQAQDFKAGLQTLANTTQGTFSNEERNKGREATVSFGQHRIAAGAFADNLSRIHTGFRGSFANAVVNSPIWNDVRHVPAPILPTVAQLTEQEQLRDAAKAESRTRLEKDLIGWLRQGAEPEAQTVVDKILDAFDADSTDVDLSGYGLKSIPPLGELKELKRLNVSGNALTSLASLTKLTGLEDLNVSANPLFTLPADLGENLPDLHTLDISRTLISKVPPNLNLPRGVSVVADEVPFLTREAVNIILRNTESSGFTHRFPADYELLRANGNRNSPQSLNYVNLQAKAKALGVSPEVIQSELRQVRGFDVRPLGPAPTAAGQARISERSSLEDNIAFYYQSLGREVPAGLVDKLKAPLSSSNNPPTDNQVDNLRRDLHRFTQIKDAKSSPDKTADLARRIVSILDAAVENEVFRDHLFSVAGDASAACEDRAALGLGRLEQEAHLLKAVTRKPVDPNEVRQLFREAALVEAATTYATEEGLKRVAQDPRASTDEVEWALSYLTVLRERGHISSGSSDLSYRNYGFDVDKVKADIPKILARVQGSQDVAITLQRVPSWANSLADIWPPFKAARDKLNDEFADKAEQLQVDLDEGKINDEQWADRLNRLQPQQQDALSALAEQHTANWLAAIA